MSDHFVLARLPAHDLTVGVAITTATCRVAESAHALASSATIALGRLLTAAALTGPVQERPGSLSLQVVCTGRLGQLFADATANGDLRGYVKNPSMALPLSPGEDAKGRRTVAAAVAEGTLGVIRLGEGTRFTQSTTPLTTGEIDSDVEAFLSTSDQVPSVLACEVLLGETASHVDVAGGVLVQALPGGNRERLAATATLLRSSGLSEALRASSADAERVLARLFPEAVLAVQKRPLRWQCRCSSERVLEAIRILDVGDLADIVAKREETKVRCDFCASSYTVMPEAARRIYEERLRGQA